MSKTAAARHTKWKKTDETSVKVQISKQLEISSDDLLSLTWLKPSTTLLSVRKKHPDKKETTSPRWKHLRHKYLSNWLWLRTKQQRK